jgi:hypothetical protein
LKEPMSTILEKWSLRLEVHMVWNPLIAAGW